MHLSGMVAVLGTQEGFSTFFSRELVGSPARRLKALVAWLYRWHARQSAGAARRSLSRPGAHALHFLKNSAFLAM